MATAAQSVSATPSYLSWFGEFLKHELSPYPGRAALVGRMVIAATLVMMICMVFRIPYAFQASIYALVVSRESSQATLKSAVSILALTGIGGGYLLASAWFVISIPTLHLLWVIASFFLGFYAISTFTNFGASSTFAIMICVGVPIWDRQLSAETNVEDTLWLCWACAIGVVVTVAVEILFSRIKPGEDIVAGVADRLVAVENLLVRFSDNSVDRRTQANVVRLAMVGTSMLRRTLQRSAYAPNYAEQMGAVIALTGRLVDLAANLGSPDHLSDDDREQIRLLAENVGSVRSALLPDGTQLLNGFHVAPGHVTQGGLTQGRVTPGNAPHTIPFVAEMDKTVQLIKEVLIGAPALSAFAPQPSSADPSPPFLVRDAFSNIKHLQFALKGCLTASLCYIIYNGVDWPGISTAVTTCFLTALSTVGSSRQKQVLRISGALVGGFLIGMGAQVFVLPYLDSIAGFTILFVVVTAFASWFMTSSPRLSYFGVQIAVAFCLIHLQSFAIEPSLSIARDRVVGILFGLIMMWLVFDQLWGASAVSDMKRAFLSAVRLLAEFAREPISRDYQVAAERSYSLREAINNNFDSVRASADGVLFEFGPSRQQDLAWRSRIREWQPQLRLIFIADIALWKYRAGLPGFESPKTVGAAQRAFDDELARALEAIADRIEGRASQAGLLEKSLASLERAVSTYEGSEPPPATAGRFAAFLSLHRRIESLTSSLLKEIGNAV
jgi:multidrug resistance protein MdtO